MSATRATRGFQERVLSRLWDEPDGLTLAELQATFPRGMWAGVMGALLELMGRGLVLEVARVHATARAGEDHSRLVVPRRRIP